MPEFKITVTIEADNYTEARSMAESMYHDLGKGLEVRPANRAPYRVTEFMIQPGQYTWVAGWNMPGYLPENEPCWFASQADAREYLMDEIERYGEHHADGCTEGRTCTECAEIDKAYEDLQKGATSVQAGNCVYWLNTPLG